MDGRKLDWIRKQPGLSKAELARQHEILRQSLYRYVWDVRPRLVALAIVGLWRPGSLGVLEEPSEAEEGMLEYQKPGRAFVAPKRSILNLC